MAQGTPLLTVVALLGLGGCELFGLGTIYCDGSDETCPSHLVCSADRVCVAPGSPAALPPALSRRTCEAARCDLLPDSATRTCVDARSAIAPCPDPGQPLHGQDAHYLIDPPAYRVEGEVVHDLVTGLRWQRAAAATAFAVADAEAHCADVGLGGLPWRLPGLVELLTIVDFGRPPGLLRRALLDDATFAAPVSDAFWSAERSAGLPWYVDLIDGMAQADFAAGGTTRGAWCVSGPPTPTPALVFSGGLWLGAAADLEWQVATDAPRTWAEALAACEASTVGGRDDWRLPSIKELATLFEGGASAGIWTPMRPELLSHVYWSSTPAPRPAGGALVASFDHGLGQLVPATLTALAQVRCVRGP